ncbi:ABC transporter permease [Enterococcus silesiacus]|uniref:ABC transporter permease n=1 Tax=Enterococcus silesiacus TaxID=332949 RepID=A0ABM5W6I3_9ENTE|nr:ABC transporter permease [Enterococcus silesiacus]ALS00789.1 ABC transporter permease [Enterococcus silesiacus]
MNFMKRALCSVTRKKGKSLILFAVIFVLGNVIAGSIAIQQSTQNVEKSVKKQLGGLATIQLDYENNQDEFAKEDLKIEPLKVDLMKKIGQSSYVKYYDYNAGTMVQTKELKSATLDSEESGAMMEGLNLKGSNYHKILDVEENRVKLVEGKVFTQEDIDNGKNVGLISSKVADENGLSVGDQMVIDSRGYDYSEDGGQKELFKIDIPIQIIGIFEPTSVEMKDKEEKKEQDMNQQYMSLQQINTVYLPNKTVLEINKDYLEKLKKVNPESPFISDDDEGEYYTPVYVLNSPDDVEAFKQETQPLLPKLYTVSASTDQYEQIGGSMKKMSQISGYVVLIAVIATLLIISLVVLLFMRDRKHELGIYLSLGDKRSHVMGQIIIEMLIISGIALILSLITGNFLGKMVSESLLNSDILSSTNDQMNMFMGFDGLGSTELTTDDIMNAYEVKFSLGYIITYLVVGLGTVLLAAILPLLYIVRLNPKKIMM